jgi:hypothetical protein
VSNESTCLASDKVAFHSWNIRWSWPQRRLHVPPALANWGVDMKGLGNLLSGAAIAGALAVCAAAAPSSASAAIIMVNGVFTDGATVTGTIDTTVYGYVSSWDLTTTAAGAFPGFVYTPADSFISGGIGRAGYEFNAQPGYFGGLFLQFRNAIAGASGPEPLVGGLGGPSYECQGSFSCYSDNGKLIGNAPGVDVRYIAGGVPEPATWAMMLVGFGGLGATMRSRRKPALATA